MTSQLDLFHPHTFSFIQEDVHSVLREELPFSSLKGKTFLVSGAGGFVASYLVHVLLAIGNVKVIVLLRDLAKKQRFTPYQNNPNLVFLQQDIAIPFTVNGPIDYVVHAASQASPKYYGTDPVGTLKANTFGTANLLEIAVRNHAQKFMFFSSGEVYGLLDDHTVHVAENYPGRVNCTDVRSCYAESKRMGETMCVCYCHQYGLPVNMLRLSHTYGPGILLNDGRVFADFAANILQNQDIVLHSDGSAKRDFCYITDMMRAFFYVLFKGENQQAYNVATGQETSILDLARTLVRLYPQKHLSVRFNRQSRPQGYIQAAASRSSFDITKLTSLGWNARIPVEEGFRRMIDSYPPLSL